MKPKKSDSNPKQKGKSTKKLPVLNPHAAGIDIGAEHHWVSVAPEQDPQPVRRFGCFTGDLYALAHWLKRNPQVLASLKKPRIKSSGFYSN